MQEQARSKQHEQTCWLVFHATAAVRARLSKCFLSAPCQSQGQCVGPHVHVELYVREAGCQPRAVPGRQVGQRLQRVLAVLACWVGLGIRTKPKFKP